VYLPVNIWADSTDEVIYSWTVASVCVFSFFLHYRFTVCIMMI